MLKAREISIPDIYWSATDTECRSRLRQDYTFFVRTRIRTRSQKSVKTGPGSGVTLQFRE